MLLYSVSSKWRDEMSSTWDTVQKSCMTNFIGWGTLNTHAHIELFLLYPTSVSMVLIDNTSPLPTSLSSRDTNRPQKTSPLKNCLGLWFLLAWANRWRFHWSVNELMLLTTCVYSTRSSRLDCVYEDGRLVWRKKCFCFFRGLRKTSRKNVCCVCFSLSVMYACCWSWT